VAQSYPGFLHCIVRQSQCLMASPGQVLVPRHGQATRKATKAFTAPRGPGRKSRVLGRGNAKKATPRRAPTPRRQPGRPPWLSPTPRGQRHEGNATRAPTPGRPPWLSPTPRGQRHEGNATRAPMPRGQRHERQRHEGTNNTPGGPTWPPRPQTATPTIQFSPVIADSALQIWSGNFPALMRTRHQTLMSIQQNGLVTVQKL
jgi:hypothetical protein